MPRTINNIYSNAGVHGNVGYEFQKHCALYILLSEFHNFADREYCIYLEHADDFVYCFFNNGLLEETRTYQAKKSSKNWTQAALLKDIITKICCSGAIAYQDQTFGKCTDYCQSSSFVTNHTIDLEVTKVDETNENVTFQHLDDVEKEQLRNKVFNEVRHELFSLKKSDGLIPEDTKYEDWYSTLNEEERNSFEDEVTNDPVSVELSNLCFMYIDFPRKHSSQKELLNGRLSTIFNDEIYDRNAAIDTLLLLFTNSASAFNQGDEISFGNNAKKISSTDINEVIGIVTSKSKAYSEWRKNASALCSRIRIPLNERKEFEQSLMNSFDYFKDLTKTEHQEIFKIAKSLYNSGNYYDEESIVDAAVAEFQRVRNTRLSNTTIKAICNAAVFELMQ